MSVERVGIVVEVTGGQEALSLMRNLESAIKRLNGTKLKFDFGGKEVQGLVTATQKAQELGNKMTEASAKSQSLGKIMGTTFNSVSSRMQHLGQSVTALGKGLQQLSSPMRALFRSTVLAAGFKALNMATEGLSGSFERYDTMQNYAKSMKALGLQADQTFKVFSGQKEAMTAIDNLNESVLGLPTGLDEIVAMQKVYAGATGEMVKSTKTAIAANNTFLASGMGSREQRFMQKYLVALASGAELTTTQWQSMARIAPLAMRAVSEEMKYSDYSKFTKDLQSGTIAGEEFLQSFIKVGTEGRVQEAANVMKTTFEGLSANVQNAFRRMGEGLLKALDDVFIGMNGRNLIQNLLGVDAKGRKVGKSIKDVIDGFSASLQNWVRANPDFFIDFLNTLKAFDWGGFVRGMGDGLLQVANALKSFLGFFSGEDVGFLGNAIRSVFGFFGLKEAEDFGRFMAKTPMFSKGLILLGNLLKGFKFPVAGIAAVLKGLVSILGKDGEKGGLFGVLAKVLGKKNDVEKVADSVGGITTVSRTLVTAFKNIALVGGIVATIGGAGFVAFRSVKTIIKDLHEIVAELNTFTRADWETAAGVVTGMVTFFGTFTYVSSYIGSAMTGITSLGTLFASPLIKGGLLIAGITTFASAVAALDMALIKSAFDSFKGITQSLSAGMEELASLKGIKVDKTALDDALKAFSQVTDAITGNNEFLGAGEGSTASSKVKASKKGNQIVSNITDMITGIKKSIEALNNLPDTSNISDARKKVTDTIRELKNVYERALVDLDMKAGVQTSERETNIATNIASLISTIKGSVSDLMELQQVDVDLEAAKENITQIGRKMGEIFTALNEAFGQEFVTDYSSDFTQTSNEGVTDKQVAKSGNLTSLLEAFTQTIGYIRQAYQTLMGGEGDMDFNLDAFSEVMNKLTGDEGILAQMKSMYDSLVSEDTGFTGDVDIAATMQGFAQAVGSIKEAVLKLQEIEGIEFSGEGGMSGVVTNIAGVISGLSTAFNSETVLALSVQVSLFVSTVQNLLNQIQAIQGLSAGNPLDIQITLTHTISGKDEIVQAIKDADTAIRDAVGNVKTSYFVPITVTLAPRVNRLPMPNTSIYPHTGGYVGNNKLQYRAKGGQLFKRKGTDIVPAMLTPGEYVQNKHAVDFWGIDFMRKVNRMDMRGVLNDVMARASHMASIGRQTIVNNTYNNQQVTINNGKAGAGFTFKSASRFAGAF